MVVDIGDIILIRICSFNSISSIMVGVEEVDSVCILDGVEVGRGGRDHGLRGELERRGERIIGVVYNLNLAACSLHNLSAHFSYNSPISLYILEKLHLLHLSAHFSSRQEQPDVCEE